ncbi:hypothetical protein [Lichenifustis flavocetrariae]|uniref:Uncharacterized protein n=1 Tax=Lichenifustis flavocetrariae TaxID=2949735 RepID=A0AA41YUE8_9HYPH|nr:hypothetical protein [Lichenifustis flavocetrariae]MCW6507063.1 hypothetical protein [Lichenifustis flavocetrariae]
MKLVAWVCGTATILICFLVLSRLLGNSDVWSQEDRPQPRPPESGRRIRVGRAVEGHGTCGGDASRRHACRRPAAVRATGGWTTSEPMQLRPNEEFPSADLKSKVRDLVEGIVDLKEKAALATNLFSVTRKAPPADRTRRYLGKLHIVAPSEEEARENLRHFLRQRCSAAKVEDFSIHRLVHRPHAEYGIIDTYMVDPG